MKTQNTGKNSAKVFGWHAGMRRGPDPRLRTRLRVLKLTICLVSSLGWVGGFPGPSWARQGLREPRTGGCGDEGGRILGTPYYERALHGLVLFRLDAAGLTEPRIAVLEYDPSTRHNRLRILKCESGAAETVYTLEEPDGEQWEELESFPSNGLAPGVVIWGGYDYSRTELIVICYAGTYSYAPSGERVEKKGTFKVAFKGDDAVLVDIDLDGIPEVAAKIGSPTPEVWTLVGDTYVKVGAFPLAELRSANLLRRIEALKKRQGPPPK